MNHNRHDTTVTWYRRPAVLGLLAIGAVFAAYYAVQNWEQTASYLPWLLILAIPLLHLFMHGGHGAHGGMGGMGGCGGHGSHGGVHDHRERAGHQHGSNRSLPAAPAPNTGDGKETADCCGEAGHAHRDTADAPTHAQGGDCCGGSGDGAAEEPEDQPQRGLERR